MQQTLADIGIPLPDYKIPDYAARLGRRVRVVMVDDSTPVTGTLIGYATIPPCIAVETAAETLWIPTKLIATVEFGGRHD